MLDEVRFICIECGKITGTPYEFQGPGNVACEACIRAWCRGLKFRAEMISLELAERARMASASLAWQTTYLRRKERRRAGKGAPSTVPPAAPAQPGTAGAAGASGVTQGAVLDLATRPVKPSGSQRGICYCGCPRSKHEREGSQFCRDFEECGCEGYIARETVPVPAGLSRTVGV